MVPDRLDALARDLRDGHDRRLEGEDDAARSAAYADGVADSLVAPEPVVTLRGGQAAVNADVSNPVVVPRRERVRAATEAEIVETARAQLVEGGQGAVTLREVGRRMGMTASALYRYVEGHAGLVDRLAADLYEDLTAHLADAVTGSAGPDALGEDVLPALVAAARAFRDWGLAHPADFRLLFGGGRSADLPVGCPHADAAGLRFGALWLDLFGRGAGLATVAVQDVADLPADPDTPLVDPVFTALPEPYREVFARSWVRLLGLVMVEVAGHHAQTGMPGEVLFEAELADLGETVRRAMAGP